MIRRFMLVIVAGGLSMAWAADRGPESAAAPRVFTAEQARAGKVAYESSCGLCHQFNLRGRTGAPGELPDINTLPQNMLKTVDQYGGQVPPLVGPRFMARWGAKSTQEYIDRVDNAVGGFPPSGMVLGDPAARRLTVLQVTAYFLMMNGGKPGKVPLSAGITATLNNVTAQPAH